MLRVVNLSAAIERPTVDQVVHLVAAARGIRGAEALAAFLHPSPPIANPLAGIPAYRQASERLWSAFRKNECITFFGDYDTDGVTSLAIMLDLARAGGSTQHRVFIPERAVDDYGLSEGALEKCVERHKPTLIFTVDCGSSSIDIVRNCKVRGIDIIVLDHHAVPDFTETPHPAFSHLNPNDPRMGAPRSLRDMSAAGLSFLFADAFAAQHNLSKWSRDRALILAGLGTHVDMMALTGINRALVKQSLRLLNNGGAHLVPGLAALRAALGIDVVTAATFGFRFGPHLNAGGRVSTAEEALRLLAASNRSAADRIVPLLSNLNAERQDIQDHVLEEAMLEATSMIAEHPQRRILVLAKREWHPGVVGVVAGKIKDAFRRPVFVCGFNAELDCFKGSGRGTALFDLQRLVTEATQRGVILSGGGHAPAAGIALKRSQIPGFQSFLDDVTAAIPLNPPETVEVMGDADAMPVPDWLAVIDHLEPCGKGNPEPTLLADRCKIIGTPTILNRRRDSRAWAMKATFISPRQRRFAAKWRNVEAARAMWQAGGVYRLIVRLSISHRDGRAFEEWDVVSCESVPPSDR